jgi:hypothetical protein
MIDMSTWAARYVRLGDRADDAPRLRARATDAEYRDDGKSAFAALIVTSPTLKPEDLSALSRDFGEALAISVHTVADLVVYDHYVAGLPVRGLTYAGEAGWVRVLGEPEPWETAALFSAAKLAELCEVLEEDFEGDVLEREKAELEKLWAAGRVEEGKQRPPADPTALSRAIQKHFGLPAIAAAPASRR